MSEVVDETPKAPTLAHKLEYAAFRAAEGVLSLFSLETTVRVGQGLGLVAWALFPKWRKLVARNLRIATAAEAPDAAEIRRRVRETFRRAGNNMLSSQRAALMTPEQLQKHIEFEGLEHLLGPVRAGRGVVLVWSHMGNWEVLAQLVKTLAPDAAGRGALRQARRLQRPGSPAPRRRRGNGHDRPTRRWPRRAVPVLRPAFVLHTAPSPARPSHRRCDGHTVGLLRRNRPLAV